MDPKLVELLADPLDCYFHLNLLGEYPLRVGLRPGLICYVPWLLEANPVPVLKTADLVTWLLTYYPSIKIYLHILHLLYLVRTYVDNEPELWLGLEGLLAGALDGLTYPLLFGAGLTACTMFGLAYFKLLSFLTKFWFVTTLNKKLILHCYLLNRTISEWVQHVLWLSRAIWWSIILHSLSCCFSFHKVWMWSSIIIWLSIFHDKAVRCWALICRVCSRWLLGWSLRSLGNRGRSLLLSDT